MIGLLVIFVFFFFISMLSKRVKLPAPQGELPTEERSVCPPHKWRYLEVKNAAGEIIKHKLVCDLCGPIKSSEGPARMQ